MDHAVRRYSNFSLRVPEAEFLRYPVDAMRDALAAAAPRLPALRRAMVRARAELLLGYGLSPLDRDVTPTRGADLVLIEVGRTLCPRTPASLSYCFDDVGAGV